MSMQVPRTSTEYLSALTGLLIEDATVEDVLNHIYDHCRPFIDYDRIGWAEIVTENDLVRARWARADNRVLLRNGFSASLQGSSLYFVMEQRRVRIMDDLETYLEHRPSSRSTQLIVREGMRSSMTCPLFSGKQPLGFLFFSSCEPNTYADADATFAMAIAKLLSLKIGTATQQAASREPSLPESDNSVISLPVAELESGMVLASPLRTKSMSLLLAAGHSLTSHTILRLKEMSRSGEIAFSSVEVVGPLTNRILQEG